MHLINILLHKLKILLLCFVTPVFVNHSFMMILIEKEVTEMNLDIDCVVDFFSLEYDFYTYVLD